MKVFLTSGGLAADNGGELRLLGREFGIDRLFGETDPGRSLLAEWQRSPALGALPPPLAPIQSQEVWAAGVTYNRSKTARMAESKDSGGGSFYDKVYAAPRPELFFKATPHRVSGPGEPVRLRSDSRWNVPEPELTLAINAQGKIFGYTIGNDMSSRDIEGENPLYLPQAKVYHRSAAIGPCLLVSDEALAGHTEIGLRIRRGGSEVFSGEITIDQIRRSFAELASFLFRDNSFPHGAYLMTGTGIVPPDHFTLAPGDEIAITIEPIGTLVNPVE